MAQIPVAVRAVAKYRGQVHLGVRLFHEFEEMNTWLPPYQKDYRSPIWAVLQNGKVRAWVSGWFDNEAALGAFIDKAIAAKGKS
jgi:hypothetical protein